MSLFKKIFGKKETGNEQEEQINGASHEPDWDFYFSNVDDIIGSFYVDLGLSNIAPVLDKTHLLWISLRMNDPKENGLSSNAEFELLNEIEDRLQEFILTKHNAVYAGRLTNDGHRDFYFYVGDTMLCDKTISEAMVSFPSYSYEFGLKEEKEWNSYFEFMYPNPRQYQSIQNRRVIERLEEHGDKLTKQREVDHWIYFKTEKDRTVFLERIKDKGFKIVDQNHIKKNEEFPYSLHILRMDYVDIDSVDEYVLHLWELAGECNGDYDGWETSVEKE